MSKLKTVLKPAIAAGLICVSATLALAEQNVIAKVGDMEITEQELAFAEADLQQEFAQVPADKRRGAVLSALIDIKLLAAKAIADGVEDNDTFKSQMDFLRSRALHNFYFQQNIAESVSDDEIRERYEAEVAVMEPQTEIKARHILVETEETAKEIISELEGGADFTELAKEKSTGPSGPNGGDLGFFAKGQMVPEFEQAAFALDDGAFTKEPVKTQFGWHVILKEEEREKAAPELDQVSDQIRQVLLRQKYFNAVEGAREDIDIEIMDKELKGQIDAARQNLPKSE
jgi:peptidyl-prolyl cis-trans isomerase C